MRQLKMDGILTESRKRYALDAALLLGFQSESAVFPVAGPAGEIPIPESDEELLSLWHLEGDDAQEGYVPAQGAGPVFELDFRKKKGLEYLFSRGFFLKDENNDLLPDRLDVKLILPEDTDDAMLAAACNLAFRFGMETTAFSGSILASKDYEGNAVIFEHAECEELVLEELPGAVHVRLRGSGQKLLDFSSLICERFPVTGAFQSLRDVLMDMTDDFALRGADGQLAYFHALTQRTSGDAESDEPDSAGSPSTASCSDEYTLYGSPEITEEQKKYFKGADIKNYKAGKKVYEHLYDLPWEADTFEQILKEELIPTLHTGDIVRIEGALSEDREVREAVLDHIRDAFRPTGAVLEDLQLICAYKQGYSWIDEVVIPAVCAASCEGHASNGPAPEKIEVYFKPFLPEGETVWQDENGATPSYHNLKADDPDKWYDLPIRYLQELYPIQDILAEKLLLKPDNILFHAYEGTDELTYLCRILMQDGSCREFRYLARYSERPYLDEYPQMGKVHPSTGYIQVWVNGEERLNRNLPTDLEQIWDIYQKQVLPECRTYIEEKTRGDAHADMQPFFQKLLLEVWASEPDYRTKSREDLISSLDALHEDMYFVGSDYFKNYGLQSTNQIFDAPGLILPKIHKRDGAPSLRVVLYERQKEAACIIQHANTADSVADRVAAGQLQRDQITLRITRIYPENGRLVLEIPAQDISAEVTASYARLFSDGILDISRRITDCYTLRFLAENGTAYEADVPAKVSAPEKKITDIDLHENELIGYETCLEIIEELGGVQGLEVFRTARSYQGRSLYGIWLKPEYEGYLSMTKRLSRCPSEIINARHHANEVSGTNAAFILLKKLLTEDIYRDLPGKLNLVLVPMENTDGAAIHYELQKEHPYWKFHVARFNAIGKEFYHDHFRQDTIHSEAMGLTRLFEKYVPDIIVDNHGVPSHEWEQQFSGYTSPSYKGFWLPRSLLYGYFWYVTDEQYRSNYPVNKVMEDMIADEIAADEEMTRWNREWSAQFEKYAHAWMPKLFPADYYKNMINYWIPFAYDPTHRYPSIRFPWITTVAYTSEVADETAQGEYLNLCARAHVAHDEATLRMLTAAKHLHNCRCECRNGQIFTEYLRLRPMIVSNSEQR